ncbi:hypothetical protein [Pseudomonas sp. TH31]|uniref:hypothetical protein n=1 Tax=Pseudomonas sp. TH31 TaxID=2796396 RepID=UPI00191382CF|nr:hypothetical protein [Pseudomonas sp. TH31]MBK5413299.1 hypothetical protein [Pseudomonas sp. TH31]
MTPEQKVKFLILALDARWQQKEAPDATAHWSEFREATPAHEDNLMPQTQVVASSGPGISQISVGVSA